MKYNNTFSKNQIHEIAHLVLTHASAQETGAAVVIALSGDLGAGKTTLTQSIAQELGITEDVISPTYVIMKKYGIVAPAFNSRFTHLIHIDAYRVESVSEMSTLGWERVISEPSNLVIVEWPEKISSLIPPHTLSVSLSHHDQETRLIVVE